MGIAERDYILRMIERLGQMIAAILKKRRDGEPAEARRMLDDLRTEMFGGLGGALDAVDPTSVVGLAGDRERARAYAVLLALEADLREEGEPRWAARARRRALEIHLESARRHPGEVRAEDRDAIAGLATHVDVAKLPDALREILAKVAPPSPGRG
jgi:hypothetical protein